MNHTNLQKTAKLEFVSFRTKSPSGMTDRDQLRPKAPDNLKISKRVGAESLLVTWTPPDDDTVTGYKVAMNAILNL